MLVISFLAYFVYQIACGILTFMYPQCLVYRLGLVPYRTAWRLQESLAAQIAASAQPPSLLLLQHPHVFTFGRRGEVTNLLWDEAELARRGVEVFWADRGGDVTYHGPGQLVGYPLLPLSPGGLYAGITPAGTNPVETSSGLNNLPKADYIGYLRLLEEVLIRTLAHFGVSSFRLPEKTGVFVNTPDSTAELPAKIASIGVKVDASGVSRHGFALNLDPDMAFWDGIIACGLVGQPAASLAQFLHPLPEQDQIDRSLIEIFGEVMGYKMVAANSEFLAPEDLEI